MAVKSSPATPLADAGRSWGTWPVPGLPADAPAAGGDHPGVLHLGVDPRVAERAPRQGGVRGGGAERPAAPSTIAAVTAARRRGILTPIPFVGIVGIV
ncbi:MAG TPA: hypothetical protein VK640_09100, partial [Actinomycetes bacterium]|nr:hypothetical protein [Actinomycetes bacterium]